MRDAVAGLIVRTEDQPSMDVFITMRKDQVAVQPQPVKWEGLIQGIAEEFSCPFSTVEQILGSERHQLEQGARIKDFIPVLAVKQVRDLLRTSRQTPA